MKTKQQTLEEMAAAFEKTPAAKHVHGTFLKMKAFMDGYFPPAARAPNRLKPAADESELFKSAVILFDFNLRRPYGKPCDAEEVSRILRGELERGFAEVDPEFFRMLARAAEYVRQAPKRITAHAAHVIAARRVAAEFFQRGETPRKQAVITGTRAALKAQGRPAYPETPAAAWTPILRDAGLSGLPKSNPGGTIKKHGEKKARK